MKLIFDSYSCSMPATLRHPELDILRTIAILLMVLYHLLFDLSFFYHADIDIYHGAWKIMGTVAALLFLMLVGISFTVSWKRTISQKQSWRAAYPKYAARGFFLLSWGLLISFITAIATPDEYIRFGILHLIGTATLLLPFFARLRYWNFIIGLWMVGCGTLFTFIRGESPFLLPFGIMYRSFTTLDYYPLFPWMGVILLGMCMGYLLYEQYPAPVSKASSPLLSAISWPGKHALAIYLIHQPILIVLLYVIQPLVS
ncbi:MAG: hypothetical protein JWM56_1212 [Candidatus Peribacteria bacterium]|nr:hypothetical protein [Candidatus Peribacteria bacterium]